MTMMKHETGRLDGAPTVPTTELSEPRTTAVHELVAQPETETQQPVTIRIYSSTDPKVGDIVRVRAQEMHTRVYLNHKFIKPEQVSMEGRGVFTDEYSTRARYDYVVNGKKAATMRTIHADKKKGGILSLPTTQKFDIDPEALAEVAGVSSVADIKPSQIEEWSGLASETLEDGKAHEAKTDLDAVLALYSNGVRSALEGNVKVIIQNVDKILLRKIQMLVGTDTVRVLGPAKKYMGDPTIPIAMNPADIARNVLRRADTDPGKANLVKMLDGIDEKHLPADIRQLLKEQQIASKEHSPLKRLVTNPKAIGYAAIIGYSSARALPTVGVDEFHGSTALLWGIDVATAIPYTWGVIETFTGKKPAKRALGALAAVSCFAAPYVYFGANGEDYPPAVSAVIGGFIGVAVAKETISRTLGAKKRKALHAGLKHSELEDVSERAQPPRRDAAVVHHRRAA